MLSFNLLIVFIQFSNADLIEKSVSLITVTVQESNVLSPAILSTLPRKGTSICAMFDAGNLAPLTKNLDLSRTSCAG